jgi:uncharacterized integral membrane protein (TIGR00697 family)
MVAFVVVLLCSNLIGTAKVAIVGGFEFTACLLFFPASYLFGDVLTEVYGYVYSRRVVWTGLVAMVFASVMAFVTVELPPSPSWSGQDAVRSIFGQTPRIVVASLAAYFAGEFMNSFVLARMKVVTGGKHLWARCIASTLAGECVDTLVFYPVAFIGVFSGDLLMKVIVMNYVVKVAWEVIAMPFTYKFVSFLKRVECVDHYDTETNFNPFKV